MKINVDKIPDEGMVIKEELSPGLILPSLKGQGIAMDKPINVTARAVKKGGEIFVDISLNAPVEYTCSRCLAKVTSPFKKDFSVSYEANPGAVLNVDEDIRQEMIVDSPMKVLCKPDCKGLCPNCGQNLNVGKCDCN